MLVTVEADLGPAIGLIVHVDRVNVEGCYNGTRQGKRDDAIGGLIFVFQDALDF